MALPVIHARGGYLFLALVIGQIGLISAQVNTRAGVPVLQAAVFAVIAEVQQAASGVVSGVGGLWSGYVGLRGVRAENQALRQKIADLEVRLQQQSAAVAESQQLHQLLNLHDTADVDTRAADVVGGAVAPDVRSITINVGGLHGVRLDMAVLAPEGVVGRVVRAFPDVAKVQLLIDRDAAAGVMTDRRRDQGIVTGVGDGTLRLEYVSATADVQIGDVVRTAGNDGIYPKGFIVGRVDDVRKDRSNNTYTSISVRPAVDFNRLEHVLVVVGLKPARTLVKGPS